MAAPKNKTLKDLNGKWLMNKSLSSSPEPALALQGISWLVRKAVCVATVTLHISVFVAPPAPPVDATGKPAVTHINIEQTASGGVKGNTEKRCLDNEWREHSDWLFGTVRGQSKWVHHAEVKDSWLAGGWLLSEEEKSGPDGECLVLSYAESVNAGWSGTQIWGFQLLNGERRHVRKIVVAKGTKRVELTMVYDWISE